jgi:hypothetical protein
MYNQKCLNRIANILKKTDLSFNKLHYLATLKFKHIDISNKPCQLKRGKPYYRMLLKLQPENYTRAG